MVDQGGQPQKPELRGEVLAANMLEQLVIQNQRLGELIQVMGALHEMMDTLCGHFDVVHLAMEKSIELKSKQKVTIADFAERWVEAVEEILPEEDDDEGDILSGRR